MSKSKKKPEGIKFRFIRKIRIGSNVFRVKWDKSVGGASFAYADKDDEAIIIIGTESLKVNPDRILELLIHELLEIIYIDLHCRYDRPDETRAYEFHYTHRQHDTACCMLAGLLTQFLK